MSLRRRMLAYEQRSLQAHKRKDVIKWLEWKHATLVDEGDDDDDEEDVQIKDDVEAILAPKAFAHIRLNRKKGGDAAGKKAAPGPGELGGTYWDALYDYILDKHIFPPIRRDLDRLKDAFHIIARHVVAQQQRPGASARELATPELRWLAVLGVSPDGMLQIRHWFAKYSLYDQPDDRYRHWARLLGCDDLYDFFALKIFLRLLTTYKQMSITFMSEKLYMRQTRALRMRLKLRPMEASPPNLGRAMYCLGCHQWATSIQTSPHWIALQGDQRLMAIEAARLTKVNRQRELKTRDHIRRLVPLGQSRGLLNPRLGAFFCPKGKKSKEQLDAERMRSLAAGITRRGTASDPTASSTQEEPSSVSIATGEEEEDDDHDNEDEAEEELNGREVAAAFESIYVNPSMESASHFRRVMHEGAAITSMTLAPNTAGQDDAADMEWDDDEDDEDDDDDDEEEEEVDVDGSKAKKHVKAANRLARRRTTLRLVNLLHPILIHGKETCEHTALINVDMRGLVFRRGNEAMALCCYCGDLTRVMHDKWTNHGLSCARPRPLVYAHFQRLTHLQA